MLGDKLFDASAKLELLKHDGLMLNKASLYEQSMNKVYEQGRYLESKNSISNSERKSYLASLRKLEKSYQNIIFSLQQTLLDAIKEDNYYTFSLINNSEIDDIYELDHIQIKAIAFYQKHKKNGEIKTLDTLINKRKLDKKAYDERVRLSAIKQKKDKNKSTIQENTPIGGRGGLEITENQNVAQSFSITKTGTLVAIEIVDIKHHRCTPTTSLYVSLINMKNGQLGSHTYYTRELHPDEITPTVKLTLGSYAPSVRKGEKYAIYLESSAESSGCTYAWGGGIETYEGGKTYVNKRPGIRDMKFRTYVTGH